MAQRVRIPHRGQSPSSVTQLPILTALHARCPTLFGSIIHHKFKKVNTYLYNFYFRIVSINSFSNCTCLAESPSAQISVFCGMDSLPNK